MNINLDSEISFNEADRKLLDTFRDMYWWRVPDDFVIFDIETTGLIPRKNTILEIGAISINQKTFLSSGSLDTFQCFIKQENPISVESQKIHKITDEMVKDGHSEFDALQSFFQFCDGKCMLAYNSSFDVSFLSATAKRCNYPIEEEYLNSVEDIYKLAKKYLSNDFVSDKRLETIANALGLKSKFNHRSLIDSLMAFYVYMFLKQLEFNDRHYDILKSIKKLVAVSGGNEKDYVNDIMKNLYPNKKI